MEKTTPLDVGLRSLLACHFHFPRPAEILDECVELVKDWQEECEDANALHVAGDLCAISGLSMEKHRYPIACALVKYGYFRPFDDPYQMLPCHPKNL